MCRSSRLGESCWRLPMAPGTCAKKSDNRLCEMASAQRFSTPGTYTARTDKLKRARIKNRHRSRCIIYSTLLVPEFTTATAPILSQCTTTEEPCHWCTHRTQAKTMGRNSCRTMLSSWSRIAPWGGGVRPLRLEPRSRRWAHCPTSEVARRICPRMVGPLPWGKVLHHGNSVPRPQECHPPL